MCAVRPSRDVTRYTPLLCIVTSQYPTIEIVRLMVMSRVTPRDTGPRPYAYLIAAVMQLLSIPNLVTEYGVK